jgi:CheY-like chemotaxis protein
MMASSHEPERRASRLRVLLVEDEIVIALLLEQMLAALGHSVAGPAARLSKAMALASQETIDVAILDVNLDGEEVYPVADILAARGIPFVFVTGYGKQGLRPEYRRRPTLSKPFLARSLSSALTEACAAMHR